LKPVVFGMACLSIRVFMEKIVPGSIVAVGKKEQVRAVVCTIRPKRLEVVYLDASGRALHQEIEWHAGAWQFVAGFQGGVPADKDARLEQYVKILRIQ
jgi:hypothetical protein